MMQRAAVLFTRGKLAAGLLMLVLATGVGCFNTAGDGQAPLAGSLRFEPEPPPSYETEGTRLATLNAYFLFDGKGGEGGASFPHKGDPGLAQAHRDSIGKLIRMLDADVVMLQEAENRNVLENLARESLGDLGYEVYFVKGRDTFTGQDIGLLSQVPVDTVGRIDARVQVGQSSKTYGVSKNLFARLTLGGRPATLIGLHFLAFPKDDSRKARREAQAAVIARFAAREADAGRAVAVLGDFNDFDGRLPDRAGSRPITDVLQRVKEAGGGPADDLRSVMAKVPQHERFTAHYDANDNSRVDTGELSAIDHILLSSALFRRLREVTYVQAHHPSTPTDHFPIVATFAP